MKHSLTGLALLLAWASLPSAAADDMLDQLGERLTLSDPQHGAVLRVSGLLDLEGYSLPQPAPGLLDTDRYLLFNPRLTTFFDAQVGSKIYAFAQARFDRGFDPGDGGANIRLDECAVRISPWRDARFSLQAGKFATIVGSWVGRHDSWENPFVLAPGPYGNLTGVQNIPGDEYGTSPGPQSNTKEYANRAPIIWGPDYGTGLAVTGSCGPVTGSAEIKNSALAAHPQEWSPTETGFNHPTFSGRIQYLPSPTWHFGLSGSSGAYLREDAGPLLPAGHGIGDFREWVLGEDVTFAWRHTQIWAECYEARFELPGGGNADSLSWYLEARQQIAVQLFAALRWNEQFFGAGPEGSNVDSPWGASLWRLDAALGYRFTPHTQLKLQFSLEHTASAGFRDLAAAQFTVKF